jgi:hypothetical protein
MLHPWQAGTNWAAAPQPGPKETKLSFVGLISASGRRDRRRYRQPITCGLHTYTEPGRACCSQPIKPLLHAVSLVEGEAPKTNHAKRAALQMTQERLRDLFVRDDTALNCSVPISSIILHVWNFGSEQAATSQRPHKLLSSSLAKGLHARCRPDAG